MIDPRNYFEPTPQRQRETGAAAVLYLAAYLLQVTGLTDTALLAAVLGSLILLLEPLRYLRAAIDARRGGGSA